MFHTKQVDKRLGWYKGYDNDHGPNETGGKAYQVVANLSGVQFATIQEAEEAAKKMNNFWVQNFELKPQQEVG